MDDVNIRIERLEPMQVVSVRVVSDHPEAQAGQKLQSWAGPQGLLKDIQRHPIFGFNNPSPSSGRSIYGYEFWIRVDGDVKPEAPLKVKHFPGGRYAVMACHGFPNPTLWKKLADWVRNSPYQWRNTHELERVQNPFAPESEVEFDLYLPIND